MVAVLQRQIERREGRMAVPGIVVSLAVVIAIAVLGPERWAATWWGAVLAAVGGGASSALASVSRGRRTNERLARRGGYQVGHEWGAWWGFDRPVTADPLFGTSLAVTALLWLLSPTLGEGVHPVVRASLLVPFTVVLVGLALTTTRGLVRRARGS